jgi:hypothetical protein
MLCAAYRTAELPPIVGAHPDFLEARGEAFDAALAELADNALEQNGLADETFACPALTSAWKLPRLAQFDAKQWTDEEGLPRENCPGDVLTMFLWTGTPAQVTRAVRLMREMVRKHIADEPMRAAAWRLAQLRMRRAA